MFTSDLNWPVYTNERESSSSSFVVIDTPFEWNERDPPGADVWSLTMPVVPLGRSGCMSMDKGSPPWPWRQRRLGSSRPTS